MIPFASWSVLTVDFLIVLHLALAGVSLAALLHLVNAKWRFEVRFLSVAFFSLYPLAFVLLLVLLFGGHMTFPWTNIHEDLPKWNNLGFLATREILGFLLVGVVYGLFIKLQAKSARSPDDMANFRNVAIFVPFVHVLFCTMVAWDFEMTLKPFWESPIYAMYHFVSMFGMFLAIFVVMVATLRRSHALAKPMGDHIPNYFAQMLLAFTILWVYFFFSQYLVIWYGNLAEETDRFFQMQNGPYSVLFWSFFVLKFVIPFPVLVFPACRHNVKVIVAMAASIILGTWIERYTWIAGTYPSEHMPMTSLFDIVVTTIVFGVGFVSVRLAMRRCNLIS